MDAEKIASEWKRLNRLVENSTEEVWIFRRSRESLV